MKLEQINTVYFLGIGGIGMSALARFFLHQRKQVHGYDLTPTEITEQLINEGAIIHFEEDVTKIPSQVDVVIYTPALSKEHKEYQYFIEKKIPLLKRSEMLGLICKDHPAIAVAGTHGKTTTTAMITQMLVNIVAFIGGVSKNLNSNFICEPCFDTVIAEADEYDRSFLTLFPQVLIITSIDADHLDIYGSIESLIESFQLLSNQIRPNGALIIYDEIAHLIQHPNKITYGFSDTAQYKITDIQYYPSKTGFDLTIYKLPRLTLFDTPSKFEGDFSSPQTSNLKPQTSYLTPHTSYLSPHTSHLSPHTSHLTPLTLNLSGKHNVLNAVAAFAACIEFSLWKDKEMDRILLTDIFKNRLSEFSGVKRRFDIRVEREDFVYIDDYAHHPEEIRAFLEAVKKCYPSKKITGVFQPHLYSRTRDFAKEFAEVLEVLDEIILLDIYPAREKPIEGITSDFLLSLIRNKNKKLLKKDELLHYLKQKKPEVLLTMGAGDIDRLVKDLENFRLK